MAFDKAVLAADIDGVIMNVTSSTESGQVSILYPSLYLPSQSLALGRTSALESASASLTLNNYGSAPLTVSRALIDDANFAVDTPMPLTIEPWQSADIAVTIGSHEAGEFKGTLQLYTNDPDNRLVNIAVDATRFIPNALSDTEISVSDKVSEVHVPLSLANTTAVSALQFDVAYDADVFAPADGAAFPAPRGAPLTAAPGNLIKQTILPQTSFDTLLTMSDTTGPERSIRPGPAFSLPRLTGILL